MGIAAIVARRLILYGIEQILVMRNMRIGILNNNICHIFEIKRLGWFTQNNECKSILGQAIVIGVACRTDKVRMQYSRMV